MQNTIDLICTECSNQFNSASLLLQHFANHAVKQLQGELISFKTDDYKRKDKSKIPNLYPIDMMHFFNESDRGSDSGIEDVNPLKFCVVTMEEKQKQSSEPKETDETEGKIHKSTKKYQCMYCLKKFGWSTDLKRHTLIHTGERPFKCPDCSSSFTRNFLLQKHQKKVHSNINKGGKLPELRPISEILSKKRRKQHKLLIKRNASSEDECTNYLENKMNNLHCSR